MFFDIYFYSLCMFFDSKKLYGACFSTIFNYKCHYKKFSNSSIFGIKSPFWLIATFFSISYMTCYYILSRIIKKQYIVVTYSS